MIDWLIPYPSFLPSIRRADVPAEGLLHHRVLPRFVPPQQFQEVLELFDGGLPALEFGRLGGQPGDQPVERRQEFRVLRLELGRLAAR